MRYFTVLILSLLLSGVAQAELCQSEIGPGFYCNDHALEQETADATRECAIAGTDDGIDEACMMEFRRRALRERLPMHDELLGLIETRYGTEDFRAVCRQQPDECANHDGLIQRYMHLLSSTGYLAMEISLAEREERRRLGLESLIDERGEEHKRANGITEPEDLPQVPPAITL